MKKISGFTFIHNAIDSGYPIVEAIRVVSGYTDEVVVVDMQSTDSTRDVLAKLIANPIYAIAQNNIYNVPIRIIDGFWGNEAGETLKQAHSQYVKCEGDIIIHFEADEVYDPDLLENIICLLQQGVTDISVYRLQIEINMQRCRWYPEPVHRVFEKHSHTIKKGHTTNRHDQATVLGPECGYLWDCCNIFRDNWINRVKKQAELRGELPQYLMTPIHSTLPAIISESEAQKWLYGGNYWTWTNTPFNIPDILKPLLGQTKYDPKV